MIKIIIRENHKIDLGNQGVRQLGHPETEEQCLKDVRKQIETKEFEFRANMLSAKRLASMIIEEAEEDAKTGSLGYDIVSLGIREKDRKLQAQIDIDFESLEVEMIQKEETTFRRIERLALERRADAIEACLSKILPKPRTEPE